MWIFNWQWCADFNFNYRLIIIKAYENTPILLLMVCSCASLVVESPTNECPDV